MQDPTNILQARELIWEGIEYSAFWYVNKDTKACQGPGQSIVNSDDICWGTMNGMQPELGKHYLLREGVKLIQLRGRLPASFVSLD